MFKSAVPLPWISVILVLPPLVMLTVPAPTFNIARFVIGPLIILAPVAMIVPLTPPVLVTLSVIFLFAPSVITAA